MRRPYGPSKGVTWAVSACAGSRGPISTVEMVIDPSPLTRSFSPGSSTKSAFAATIVRNPTRSFPSRSSCCDAVDRDRHAERGRR